MLDAVGSKARLEADGGVEASAVFDDSKSVAKNMADFRKALRRSSTKNFSL
jgi:hypothetical protein